MIGPTYEPLESLPPARKKIVAAMLGYGMERPDVEELLADFASELADEIREERDLIRDEMNHGLITYDLDTMSYAANIIDPYSDCYVDPA